MTPFEDLEASIVRQVSTAAGLHVDCLEPRLTRIDIYYALYGVVPYFRQGVRTGYVKSGAIYDESNRVNIVTVGKGNRAMRLYDKEAEAKARRTLDDWQEIWGVSGGPV
jgi:hypothetical protein